LSDELTVGQLMDWLKDEHRDAVVRIVHHGKWRVDQEGLYGRWRPWEIEGGEPDDEVRSAHEMEVLLVTDRHENSRLVPGVGWIPRGGDGDCE
jgi:hypothetical protein